MGLVVSCRQQECRLNQNRFYDLLRTYHAPYVSDSVTPVLLVCWPGLWSRKNLSLPAGSVSLLVCNKMESSTQMLTLVVASVLHRTVIHRYSYKALNIHTV